MVTMIGFIFVFIWLLMDTMYFSKPPKPEVSWKNNRIPTTIGSNCWQGSLKGSCVDYVYASPWDMGLRNGSVTMTVPAQKGTYVYMIYAKWDQGNPNYTFSIKVE